jgi:hypothetical protein
VLNARPILRRGGILLAIVSVGLLGYYYLLDWEDSQLRLRIAEQRRARDAVKLPLPISVGYEKTKTGAGFTAMVRNESIRRLSVAVTLTHPALHTTTSFRVLVNAKEEIEMGQPDAWTLASGDVIDMTHRDYKDAHFTVP